MAKKDDSAFDILDDEYDELFREMVIEDDGDAAACAGKPPTSRDTILDVATKEGSRGEAHEAGSGHEPDPVIQQTDQTINYKQPPAAPGTGSQMDENLVI